MNRELNNNTSNSSKPYRPSAPPRLEMTGTLSGATLLDGSPVRTTALMPVPFKGLDDLHVLPPHDKVGSESSHVARLFAVENPNGEPFRPDWVAAVSGRVKGGNFAQTFRFEVGPFGYRLMLYVNIQEGSFHLCDSFCDSRLLIGFKHCRGSLQIDVNWNRGIHAISFFSGSALRAHGGWQLPDPEQPQAQGFMLMLVNALDGIVVAARFVRLPHPVMRTFNATVQYVIQRNSNIHTSLGAGTSVCAIDEDTMMSPADCSLVSLLVNRSAVARLEKDGALEMPPP
jgi:hypothetical protein